MDIQLLKHARALLETITPLHMDCGKLCKNACCAFDCDVGGAVALFPGEEAFYADCDWTRVIDYTLPSSGLKTHALVCEGHCVREARPLNCRVFPLVLQYSKKQERWVARMDRRAFMVCPLASHGVKGLRSDFVRAVEEAARTLSMDNEGERMLYALAAEEKAYHISPDTL